MTDWTTAISIRFAGAALALMSAGCSFAPIHERPAAPVAAQWQQDGPASPQAGDPAVAPAAELGWRDYYAEPALQHLIALALENNRDLRIAALNVEAARARYGIQRADRLPGVDASAAGVRQRLPADIAPARQAGIASQYDATVGITAFELDLFGRVRNLGEAALAEYFATAQARRAVHIGLIAQVADNWLSLLAARERMDLLDRTLAVRAESLGLIRLRHDVGAANELELRQAEALVETARAERVGADRQRRQARNALELLVGQPLADDDPGLRTLSQVQWPKPPATGLPSELLERRPDILAAEDRLRGANANIGAARAAFFPRITLAGSLGTASAELDGLFDGGSGFWSFVPRITLPIFDGGRNRASLDLAEVRRDLSVAEYERAIQVAFREVADALAARATLDEQLRAQRAQVSAARRSLELADLRYRGGVDSQLSWLDAQRSLLASEQALLAARAAQVSNLIELYKVLGGGWSERGGQAGAPGGDSVVRTAGQGS